MNLIPYIDVLGNLALRSSGAQKSSLAPLNNSNLSNFFSTSASALEVNDFLLFNTYRRPYKLEKVLNDTEDLLVNVHGDNIIGQISYYYLGLGIALIALTIMLTLLWCYSEANILRCLERYFSVDSHEISRIKDYRSAMVRRTQQAIQTLKEFNETFFEYYLRSYLEGMHIDPRIKFDLPSRRFSSLGTRAEKAGKFGVLVALILLFLLVVLYYLYLVILISSREDLIKLNQAQISISRDYTNYLGYLPPLLIMAQDFFSRGNRTAKFNRLLLEYRDLKFYMKIPDDMLNSSNPNDLINDYRKILSTQVVISAMEQHFAQFLSLPSIRNLMENDLCVVGTSPVTLPSCRLLNADATSQGYLFYNKFLNNKFINLVNVLKTESLWPTANRTVIIQDLIEILLFEFNIKTTILFYYRQTIRSLMTSQYLDFQANINYLFGGCFFIAFSAVIIWAIFMFRRLTLMRLVRFYLRLYPDLVLSSSVSMLHQIFDTKQSLIKRVMRNRGVLIEKVT
eukprot:TRINITY_DN11677_c0_g1_i1.p1 TRINITY_DN11677_c0_g1~~TRINITY_DN11677_c0_g1_i1.p1  ORF type:complete len:510 (-),score=47.05 TRINITY_DN11677_c0_g1_i1:123-1652(-)